jgi:hypothetical protein
MENKKRLSLDETDVLEVYEKIQDRFLLCYNCDKLKKKLERYLGPAEVRRIKRVCKKHPYDKN